MVVLSIGENIDGQWYSRLHNLKANMQGMQQFFKDGNVKISAKDSQTIASIFKQCDTEGKTDASGKEVGDGKLNANERSKFLGMLQKVLPEAVYRNVEDFIVTVGVIEGLSGTNEETKAAQKEAEAETQKNKTINSIKSFNTLD